MAKMNAEERHLVEEAKNEATCVALWAYQEKNATPTWRWLRLRFLEKLWKRKCSEVDELAQELKADEPPTSPEDWDKRYGKAAG